MNRFAAAALCTGLIVVLVPTTVRAQAAQAENNEDGWISLFDGRSLDGWRASEDKGSFTVREGMIVAQAEKVRSHLFYEGPVQDGVFEDFELKVDVMTTPGSNGGIYFHTAYQETEWPQQGYEVQVNNSHVNKTRTGSLFAVVDKTDDAARDNEWFTEHITVRGKHIVIKVDGRTIVDYTEPENVDHPKWPLRKVGRGTFALQAHDPNSVVYYKNVRVKPIP